MRRLVMIIVIVSVLCISGCSKTNYDTKTENHAKKIEGMEYLYEDNPYGYYFDIYSKLSKESVRTGIIEVNSIKENLYFFVENAGKQREIAIQFFINYKQVPVLIEGKKYDTYYINADSKFSNEYSFQIAYPLEENTNYKLMAAMTVSSDIYTTDTSEKIASDIYSIAYDVILQVDSMYELCKDKEQGYEIPKTEYNDLWEGILINNDIVEWKRSLPPKEIVCKTNEEIRLQYQVGGFDNCHCAMLILSLDMKQIDINDKNYVLFDVGDGLIENGCITIKTPKQPGSYDLTGWLVEDPFDKNSIDYIPLRAIPRFTITVVE